MAAVVASTLLFVLAVESVGCRVVVLLLTCSRSSNGCHNNPSVDTPSLLSNDKVVCVSKFSAGMVSKNAELLEAHFLRVNPAVLRSDDNCSWI